MMSLVPAKVQGDFSPLYDYTGADIQLISEATETYGSIGRQKEKVELDFSSELPTSGSVTVSVWDATTDDIQGSLIDYTLLFLQMAVDNKDETSFIRVYQAMKWEQRTVDDFLTVIDLALSVGAYLAARRLAAKGIQKFPEHGELRKMSTLLSPPEITVSDRNPDPGIRANRDWLKSNRSEYLGSWVALRDGKLLYTARSIEEVIAEIGEIKNKRVLVTKVY